MGSALSCWLSLWTLFLLGPISGSEPRALYTVSHSPLSFELALEKCSVQGSYLAELRTQQEASDIQALLSTSLSASGHHRGMVTFWVGLRKAKDQCVVPELLLRGFNWTESRDQVAESTTVWREEPRKTCTTERCAMLEGEFDGTEVRSWGLVSKTCKSPHQFICKLRDRREGEQDSVLPLPGEGQTGSEERATGSRIQTTPRLEPVTTPDEPKPQTTPGPEPGLNRAEPGPEPESRPGPDLESRADPERCGGHTPQIPGARSLSPAPLGGSMMVECWSKRLVELLCSGSPAAWRLNGSTDAVCQACKDGFQRDSSGNCLDIDECLSTPCRQDCINTKGSYQCVCYDQQGTQHAESSDTCQALLKGGDGDTSPTDRPHPGTNPSLTSPPPVVVQDAGGLSAVLIPALGAVMGLLILLVLVLVLVRCCVMRRSKKRAMRKAEKMAMRSKEQGKDAMETTNEKEAT